MKLKTKEHELSKMGKLVKDIVHGYIELDEDYINIINSSEFQRLRNVRQTSYSSLYPSSLHDRFTHSLGVFALGKYAFYNFKNNVNRDFCEEISSCSVEWEKKEQLFLKACLLHDIGHSPFSHTGEKFYLLKKEKEPTLQQDQFIYHELVRVVGEKDFEEDFNEYQLKKQNAAKAHEIMSAIIGIKQFLVDQDAKNKSLFARMIIGLKYCSTKTIEDGINNALIQLLNSSVIDVDRLDYLARDRIMTGFENARIDTSRLLASVCLINKSTDKRKPNYVMGYYKNALSVIENVVVAHDGEKKWIQSHPVVVYDSFLVEKMIEAVEFEFGKDSDIFCEEALGEDGIVINCIDDERVSKQLLLRHLSDADILFLVKQLPKSNRYRNLIDEYFSRNNRKTAIWKSEAEYDLMLRELGESDRKNVLELLDSFVEELKFGETRSDSSSVQINESKEKSICEECDKKKSLSDKEVEKSEEFKKTMLEKMSIMKKVADKFGMEYDFVISMIKPFDSNAKKLLGNDVLIKYKTFELAKPIGEIISTYSLNKQSVLSENESQKMYYIYYKKAADKKNKFDGTSKDKDQKCLKITPVNVIKFIAEELKKAQAC